MASATSYRTSVVGTDGSQTSLRAVDHAGALAGTSGAPLVIVTAYQPLSDAAARARRAGTQQVETVALRGEPVGVLETVAAQTNAELLVVGDVGLNTLAGRLFGPIPARTARRSSIDVLLAHTS